MAYKISTMPEADALLLSFSPPSCAQEHFHSREEVFKQATELKLERILVDLSQLNDWDGSEMNKQIRFADGWKKDLFRKKSLAVVLPSDKKAISHFLFMIRVSKANGANIATFYRRAKALDWLKQQELELSPNN